ncbi:MAG: TonB-dependent receptor, partial [Myxococcales bacterium]|nr:TonB-dependent receptor [Myxococcales bacterium]
AGYDETLSSFDYAAYLQDRWALRRDLYVNAGLRWELQDLRDIYGRSRAVIADNVAPRLGVVYDWTSRGLSRLYANYGRYYQPLPLQLNSRVFGGLVNVGRSYVPRDCEAQSTSLDGVAHPREGDRSQPTEWCVDRAEFTTGLFPGAVVPRLRGSFNRQLQLGYEHEVIEDLVLGVRWLHSQLGRAVEDVSPNAGLDFVLANPGVGVSERELADQRGRCEALTEELDALADAGDQRGELGRELARCEFLLAAYAAVDRSFARPKRTFDALSFQLRKRFANNWLLLATYTYSRLRGNYDGFVDPVTGAINLGASVQYDVPELIVNSQGPLAGDIPHRLELDAFYTFDLRTAGRLTIGTRLRVESGWAISHRVDPTLDRYRGSFANYLLPRGSGGRIDPNYQWNLSLDYAYPLPRDLVIELGARVLNVTNARSTLRVDEVYSNDRARPIAGGDLDDLRHAKVARPRGGDAAAPYARDLLTPQRNYGVATRFQQPISAQFELALRF